MSQTLAEAFNPRANSIGFLRWAMAFLVIFSHAGPLGGFYGGHDLGVQWSTEQSFGGVAVCGFFFLSGFLITKSRQSTRSTGRYLWKRILRIYPAWLATLLVTAFVLAPIAFVRETGSIDGYFTATVDSPFTYFSNNMWLPLVQHGIAGMGDSIPYFTTSGGGTEWNGSAWTLAFEFSAYLFVGVLGMIGLLARRRIAGIIAAFVIFLACIQWLYAGQVWTAFPALAGDFRSLLLLAPFAWGMIFALFGDQIPIDWRIAAVAIIFAAFTYGKGGWLLVGQYAFCYFLIWFAIRIKALNNWERFGDFSYGIYIIAWPAMQFAAYFGLQNYGWLVYHLVIVAVCHVYAFLSWHLIEKPAMSLKSWTPAPVAWLSRNLGAVWASTKQRVSALQGGAGIG